MAGDWIKMRGELWTHPKFIALSNALIYGETTCPGFLIYVCGEDALGIGAYPPNNETITKAALRHVTKSALRHVTMGVLLRVWCAVNAHCKVQEYDAICSPMSLSDLDEIAGFDGFGEALESVRWVEQEQEKDALIFRDFLKYNEPAASRKKALTNAERQAKYRESKATKKSPRNESNESNAREEKRREDSKPTPPIPPENAGKKKRVQRAPETPLPADFEVFAEMAEWAKSKGLTDQQIDAETERFIAHHQAKGTRWSDWEAAWRKWILNAIKYGLDVKPPAAKPAAEQPQLALRVA